MASAQPRLQNVGPDSFEYREKLGAGSFGTVYKVVHKTSGETYAMKILLRKKIESAKLIRYTLTERNIMSSNRHPYIVGLHSAFQTQTHFVLVMQYCSGGTLRELVKQRKHLPAELSRHYAAQVLLAIGHLHERKVLYRDLKPENVVLDQEGHALITDFGLSKEGVEWGDTAKSFLGSICYLAPEILARSGHDHTVDIYGLGIMVHYMLHGQVPFFNTTREKMWTDIQTAVLVIPSSTPEDAATFITETLNRTPSNRPGANRTSDCHHHAYFASIDFERLFQRKVPTPSLEESPLKDKTELVKVDRHQVFGRANHCARVFKCLQTQQQDGWDYTGTVRQSGLFDKLSGMLQRGEAPQVGA